jgi:glycosyltransferase involved in cell wall biosynthesis
LQPFFSIILPTLNSEKQINDALSSIVNQNFKNYEVVIMDGLSSDGTLGEVKKIQKVFPNIKIFSEPDKGIYDAMNKGIEYSVGEWLYFMGADDKLYNKDTLQNIYGVLSEDDEGLEVIYGNVESGYFSKPYDGKFSKFKIARKNICHQAIFLKRSVFSELGAFNLDYKVLADWEHNIRWFFKKKIKHRYMDIIVAHYGENGFSSKHEDIKFHHDKNYIIAGRFFGFLKDIL